MGDVLVIDDLLRERGFDTPAALERGRELLCEAGLTRPGKTGISAAKLEVIDEALATVDLVCDNAQCQRLAGARGGGRERLTVSANACHVCGGKDAVRAAGRMGEALAGSSIRRILILGGTPTQHRELRDLTAGGTVELRCIDGSTGAHSSEMARSNLEWADLTLIWASTPISHKVTQAYTNTARQRARCPQITVSRRGIPALCDAVVEHLRQRP